MYIWEGPDDFCIMRGYQPVANPRNTTGMNIRIKHKGAMSKFMLAENIDLMFLSEPKKLRVGSGFLDGWQVYRVKRSFGSGEPYIPDVPPVVATMIDSLRNQLAIMTRKYHEARKLNYDREQRDLFRAKVKDDFKFIGDAKNKLFTQNDYGGGGAWSSPFTSRWNSNLGSGGGDQSE